MPKYTIKFTYSERQTATDWHGGQESMLYAISSTGALKLGTHAPRVNGKELEPDAWFRYLAGKLETEAHECLDHATADQVDDIANLKSIAAKARAAQE